MNKTLMITLFVAVTATSGCLMSLRAPFRFAEAKSSTHGSKETIARRPKEIADKNLNEYEQQIVQRLAMSDFEWIDQEAAKVRANKERLPGGYWKLRTLYGATEHPANALATDGDWEDLIHQLGEWSKQRPASITAKVALATAWQLYAWKARGSGYADTVSAPAWKTFATRLEKSSAILSEAASLKDRCPEWYVTAILVGLGQNWERSALDRIFEAGTQLEPTYYYLYQAKATYLLPQWGGPEGAWETFAEQSALKLGGHQGDIVFFAIYSQVLSLNGLIFMNTHQQAVPKLIAGFRSIEKLYGVAPHRLNEACFFATFGNDLATANDLFNRIGGDYDESVWLSQQNFELFRAGTQQRAKASQSQAPSVTSSSTKPPQKN